jgi:hypothetical protein
MKASAVDVDESVLDGEELLRGIAVGSPCVPL